MEDPFEPPLPDQFADFRDLHEGASILVCGCGSSLSLLAEPERFVTIGVNDVGKMFQPDYLVVLNTPRQFSGDRFDSVRNSRSRALFTHLDLPVDHPRVVRFRLGKRYGTEPTDDSLPHTRNSPYLAANLARFLGARRIGLIGVDFRAHHFWGRTGTHSLQREVRQINREYRRLAEAFATHGVELVNLSPFSSLTDVPRMSLGEFAAGARSARSLRLVSYSMTPVVGVPKILSDCINARTTARSTALLGSARYRSGLTFGADATWSAAADAVAEHLDAADLAIVHNGRVAPIHRARLEGKPVLTMAHNEMTNVDPRFVRAGNPGVVVAQYPAGSSAFDGWGRVPNPIPLWDERFRPGVKQDRIRIVYTPADRHGVFADSDPRFMHSKGHPQTVRILNRLATRHPVDLVVRRAHPLEHERVLAAKRTAHIVIDECVTGGYHRNSLEGLAAGCIVVNAVGTRPHVVDALRGCTSPDACIPFETATLDTLEQVLDELIGRGARQLVADGAANRRWMERHWNFEDQWRRFWIPALDRALGGPPRRFAVVRSTDWIDPPTATDSTRAARATAARPAGSLTVVIPYGERVDNDPRRQLLDATLERLKQSHGAPQVLVSEIGNRPHAQELCERHRARHAFLDVDPGPFPKARAVNHGLSLASTTHVLVLDADLLLPPEFCSNALVEAETRQLDGLVPWRWIGFLSPEDSTAVVRGERPANRCRPVARFTTSGSNRAGAMVIRRAFFERHGGMLEAFRGWGCEDNAFYTKVERLGRAGVTRRREQHAFHLHHELSALDRDAAAAANPQHELNRELLARVRSCRSAKEFTDAFPAEEARVPAPATA